MMTRLPLFPHRSRLLTFLLALLLWGGAMAASTLASDLTRDLAAGRSRKVVVYGTSLTAGGAWVSQMQSWLASNYSGALTLINSGLSGQNSSEGVAQLSAKVLAYQPDTVFIEFAMNDAFLYTPPTPSLSVAEARANLLSMITSIRGQNPRAEIILQTTNPVWNSPTGTNQSATLRPNLAAYYQMYREVAAERDLLLIDHHPNWLALQASAPATFEAWIADGTHPNAEGNEAIVLPLLQRQLIGEVRYAAPNLGNPTLLTTDVCVYGGTSGAVAAAVQVARQGKRAVLLSPDAWLGGLSSNGLGWTDIGDANAIGGLAREFYRRVYQYYLSDRSWTQETRANYLTRSTLDPDEAAKMMFTFEPKVARQIFQDLLAEAGVTVVRGRLKRSSGGVQRAGRLIREIMTDDGQTSIRAAMFIDATYEGDLMAAANVSYTVGREPNSLYAETHNGIETAKVGGNQLPNGIDPYVTAGQPGSGLLPGVNATAGGSDGTGDQRLQAYTFRMCLTDLAANRVPVPQPAGYQESDYELLFRAIAAGQTSNFFKTSPMPNRKTDSNNSNGFSTDFIGGNYSLTEGWNYAEADYARRDQIVAAHLRYQQGFVWTLQNSARVPASIRNSLAGWGLPLDEFTESGRWPGQLYVREARRMVGDFVLTQQHANQLSGYVVSDPVGMGGYQMDSHHTQRWASPQGVKNEGDIQIAPSNGPYGISYRCLLPKASEVENLLVPVCVSASHIAYGSIRMEPVFMILGQSAGAAAVRAIGDGVSVQGVDYGALQRDLRLAGQILSLSASPAGDQVIVDNDAASGVALTGAWTVSTATAGYYGSDYLHDGGTGQGTKRARFTPALTQAGNYEVFARWTAHTNRASNARFDVIHSAGTTTRSMNQRTNNGVWVSLGTYAFATGSNGAVEVRNDGADGYVVADAVLFSKPQSLPAVSVLASAATAEESGAIDGAFTVMRNLPGSTDLTVTLAWSGTASAGSDFKALPTTITIPAGSLSATVSVAAFADHTVEGSESVIATLVANAAYSINAPSSATVQIVDPPFDRWKALHFTPAELANPTVGADSADGDRDGRSNFLEFALGSAPKAADARDFPTMGWYSEGGSRQLRLYYPKPESNVTFEVQRTLSLTPANWNHEGVSAEAYDGALGLFYQALPITNGMPSGFLRLQITQP